MAVDRMIRAEMRTSEKVNRWPIPLRFFWTQLWGYCDDFGRGVYDCRLIVADTFPLDDEITAETVARWMLGLEQEGVIRPYTMGGRRYFEVVNWDEHQELKYRKKSKIPAPLEKVQKSSETFRKIVLEEEVEEEIEGEGEALAPPSPFCFNHPNGTDQPCRACKRARERSEAWTPPKPPKKHDCDRDGHTWQKDGSCLWCIARTDEIA